VASLQFGEEDIEDDRLRLIFTCCHPALALPARVALTLRTVAGLSVAEIASAFLVSEATMAQRLVRARRRIDEAGIPYRVPPPELLGERLGGVLAVIYLVFNQGYSAVARHELAGSAISLASAVVTLMPGEPEARALARPSPVAGFAAEMRGSPRMAHSSRLRSRIDGSGITRRSTGVSPSCLRLSGPLCRAGRHCRLSCEGAVRRPNRLACDRRVVRQAARARAVPGGRAGPCGSRWGCAMGPTPGLRFSTPCRWGATGGSRPHGLTCCVGPAGCGRLHTSSGRQSPSPHPARSSKICADGSPKIGS
jgi:hypothetical protein